MKESLQNELAFFGGYTNGYIGYLPTKEEFAYGGYEVELSPVVYDGYEFIDATGGKYCGADCEEGYGFM